MSDYNLNECEYTLKKLVAVDTSQPKGNERDIIDVIESLLTEGEHHSEWLQFQRFDHGNNRASLVAKIDGQNSAKDGLAFVGHVDTVAFGDISKWTHHPLSAHAEKGMVYGRGSADQKGGVAAMIIAAKHILRSAQKPKRTLLFCFTADEEFGGIGVLSVVKSGLFDDVSEIIITEPTDEQIGICEKGALWLKITASGALAHGSRPEVGINAIDLLTEFLGSFKKETVFEGVHELLNTTTCSVTKISGGIMANVIPDTADMTLDIRTLPGVSSADVIKAAKGVFEEICKRDSRIGFDLEVITDQPPAQTSKDAPIVTKMGEIFRRRGMDDAVRGLYFYTDIGRIVPFYQHPFIILGPGDDKQAHQLNEFIEIASVARISEIYVEYIEA